MDAARNIELKQEPAASDHGPYRFERRRAPRMAAEGQRLAVVFGTDGGRWLLPLEIRDSSSSGIGLVSRQPLTAGDRITLYDEGRRATFIKGVVARCGEREDGQFDLGLTCPPTF
ncbi:MAG: hypothetical protein ACFCBV_09500 [Phycisphaerales bacterium]